MLNELSLTPTEARKQGLGINLDGRRRTAFELLAQPNVDFEQLRAIWPTLGALSPEIANQLAVDARYAPYVRRQELDVEAYRRDEAIALPQNLHSEALSGLSAEIRQKLERHKPATLAQAARIEGMTPSALMLLLAHAKKARGQKACLMPQKARPIQHIDGPEAFMAAFEVSRETTDILGTYAELLIQWQKAVNLVAPSTLGEIWHRHFADSAQLAALVPSSNRDSDPESGPESAETWVDLGSGAGFPGLVLVIILRNRKGAKFTLVESDSRKAAFLKEVARRTAAPVDILAGRIELPSTQSKLQKADVVTARALAPLERLFLFASALTKPDTKCLFLKGKDVRQERLDAEKSWSFSCSEVPSMTNSEGRILVIENLRPNSEG